MSAFTSTLAALLRDGVRFVIIGAAGANYYAQTRGQVFATQDRDLFLPPSASNLLKVWNTLDGLDWRLWNHGEPLGKPFDLGLAESVISHRAAIQATLEEGRLEVDLTLEMKGFSFEEVWTHRRTFESEGVAIPVARLEQIVRSKRAVGRPKDHLFITTHADLLQELLGADESE